MSAEKPRQGLEPVQGPGSKTPCGLWNVSELAGSLLLAPPLSQVSKKMLNHHSCTWYIVFFQPPHPHYLFLCWITNKQCGLPEIRAFTASMLALAPWSHFLSQLVFSHSFDSTRLRSPHSLVLGLITPTVIQSERTEH